MTDVVLGNNGKNTIESAIESGGGGGDLSAIAEDVLPATDNTYDLGSAAKRWEEAHVVAVLADSVAVGDALVPVKATVALTIDTQVTAGDTFALGGTQTYTFTPNGEANQNGEIDVGANLAATQANIVAALQGSGENQESEYVRAANFSANVSVVTALIAGTQGNGISCTSNFTAPSNGFATATLLGGVNGGYVEVGPDPAQSGAFRLSLGDFLTSRYEGVDQNLVGLALDGNLYLGSYGVEAVLPGQDADLDFGSENKRWKDGYFRGDVNLLWGGYLNLINGAGVQWDNGAGFVIFQNGVLYLCSDTNPNLINLGLNVPTSNPGAGALYLVAAGDVAAESVAGSRVLMVGHA